MTDVMLINMKIVLVIKSLNFQKVALCEIVISTTTYRHIIQCITKPPHRHNLLTEVLCVHLTNVKLVNK